MTKIRLAVDVSVTTICLDGDVSLTSLRQHTGSRFVQLQ